MSAPLAVAGGGIAGLATALALAQAGHPVTVFEAVAAPSEAGAGVQLSPNATRVLARLGLMPGLADTAVRPAAIRIRRARDGADLARLPLGAAAEHRYGAPFLLMHRGDLQAALLRAVRADPRITLRLGTPVTGADLDGSGVLLRTGPGEATRFAGLVGADGLHSRLRARLTDGQADPLRFSGRTAWRALVPVGHAPAPAREPVSTLWLGPRAHLVHYPVRHGSLVNVVAIVEGEPGGTAPDPWSQPGDPARLGRAFAAWSCEARDLLAAAPPGDWRVWPLFERAPLPRWAAGALVLVGDAAHPMLPFMAQGAAQAIEDAGALGEALQARPDAVADAFARFERARRPQAERVVAASSRQGRVYHLGGPAALARDAAFGLLGPARMLARFDWLYGAPPPRPVASSRPGPPP